MIWLQISSGQGPDECGWVVQRLFQLISMECASQQFELTLLKRVTGNQSDSARSILCSIEGTGVSAFIKQHWEGTIQWVGKSPYRPQHKRSNWYVGVHALAFPEKTDWTEKDLKYETMRASGPGGQHVNKTETAVRITHLPTGLTSKAQEERSQSMNRKLALARLADALDTINHNSNFQKQKELWEQHTSLERGNPKKVYEGPKFKLKNLEK